MTKKDYELIAYCIFTINTYYENTYTGEKATEEQIADRQMILHRLSTWFADNLQKGNPRFNRAKFLTACGVVDETGSIEPAY